MLPGWSATRSAAPRRRSPKQRRALRRPAWPRRRARRPRGAVPRGGGGRPAALLGRGGALGGRVAPLFQLLADFEEGESLRLHADRRSGARVAPLVRAIAANLEAAEPADLDPLA